MDQYMVVRIDDSHVTQEAAAAAAAAAASHGGRMKVKGDTVGSCQEVGEGEEPAVEDDVFVFEYSNPEEEGESYQFTVSVDKLPSVKRATVRDSATAPPPVTPKMRKMMEEEEEEGEESESVSSRSVLALGEDFSDVMESSRKHLVCSLCPPPGKLFKKLSGLAVHLSLIHNIESKKKFFCPSCKQTLRTQTELDTHTHRHARQDAVFTCHLCSAAAKAGFNGTKHGLRSHLEKEHPGVVPRCDICDKGFKTVASYLADQFRHVGVSPFYCAECQVYEMTQRGLNAHVRNHDRKRKQPHQETTEHHLTGGGASNKAENSLTDDSDF